MLKEAGKHKVQYEVLHNNWIVELGKIQFTELYYLMVCLRKERRSTRIQERR